MFIDCVEACAKMISAAKYQMQTNFETVPISKIQVYSQDGVHVGTMILNKKNNRYKTILRSFHKLHVMSKELCVKREVGKEEQEQ